MRRGAKDPELFDIVPGTAGESWTINGEPTDADTPKNAINRVHALATRFPAQVNIHDGEEIIALELDKRGRTRPMPETPEEVPAAAPAAPVEPTQDSEDADRPRRFPTPARVAGAVLLVAVVGLGVFAVQGTGDGLGPEPVSEEPVTPEGWMIPSGQSAVSIIGNRVVTAEDTIVDTAERVTVRLLDAETGEEVWSVDDVESAAQVRSLNGSAASAVDTGTGEVAVLIDGEVSVLPGVLNARGTEPVITQERDYTTAEGTTRPLEDTQAVLGAIDQGAVLFDSPNRILVEGNIAQLAAPEAEATITQAIRVTDERAVMVWSRGDTRWLVTHNLATGDAQLEEEIGAAEVTVRTGIVWIGSDRTLTGDEIRPVCEGGEQVNATILCPTNEGWETADGTEQYRERPTAISPSYTVTAGTVTQRNTP